MAYDVIAPVYGRISEQRRAYLNAIDRLVIAEIPPGARSLLDVGAGDGSRAARIAQAAGITDLVLLEPSAQMRAQQPREATIWAMRAEDLHDRQGSFDAITCLWNVLGHIFPAAARADVLREFGRLASPSGRIFVDVNHRYNARHYGAIKTALRFARDLGAPLGAHGDVRVEWDLAGYRCATAGHVFTDAEFAALARAAGLRILKRFVVNYRSGGLRRWSFEGNLMYVLSR
ncbi:MAG: class I SAM-dependent methyltransferase [Bryobacteraceae bacterium]